MSDCNMSVEYNLSDLVEGIVNSIEVKFLDEESKPTTIAQAMQAAHHITKSIAEQIKELSSDRKFLAMIAKGIGLHKFIDEEKHIDDLVKQKELPEEIADLLKSLVKTIKKHGKNAS